MTIPEPLYQHDDTQPNPILAVDILPEDEIRPKKTIPAWMLLGLILFSTVSLIATLSLLFSGEDAPNELNIEGVDIILRVAGEQREISTQAQTVADILAQEAVVVSENDIVFPNPETALTNNMLITVARARTVTLIVDGDTQILQTPYENPSDILAQATITLNENDSIWLDGSLAELSDLALWSVPVNEIIIDRAYEVTIVEGDSELSFITQADTIGDALFEQDIVVYITDTVIPEVSSAIDADITVTIERARPITINVDEVTIETRVQGTTVADALAESGIALVGLDYTIPAEDSLITPETVINVLRVTESIESTDSTIAYDAVYQADANLELDQQQITQTGISGIERLNERVRFENGVEVSREPINTEIVQAVQNQVISYGTNIVIRAINTPEGAREYWRVIRAYATSYHPEALGGDDRTSIGMTLQHGIIAANPNIIPYRTNLFVQGYGIGIMADTGGARSSPFWVDLGYSDADFVGWHEYVDVYLLTPVPSDVDYLLPDYRPLSSVADN